MCIHICVHIIHILKKESVTVRHTHIGDSLNVCTNIGDHTKKNDRKKGRKNACIHMYMCT